MCCSESGYIVFKWKFMKEYVKKNKVSGSLGALIIMKRTSFLHYPSEYEIFFDNFFTSFDLERPSSSITIKSHVPEGVRFDPLNMYWKWHVRENKGNVSYVVQMYGSNGENVS